MPVDFCGSAKWDASGDGEKTGLGRVARDGLSERFMARPYVLQGGPTAPQHRIDYTSELNPQQCAAVTAPPGPALVIAGAGSGKTRTLTYRVAYLIENGIDPSNILLLTFTNKAAKEMLSRVADLVPMDLAGLWGGTFHSIGNRILRRHAVEAGYRPGFSIMDREDSEDLLRAVVATLGIDPKEKRFPKPAVLGGIFSLAVNMGESLGKVLTERREYLEEFGVKMAEAWKRYESKKMEANVVDFDDLLVKSLSLLKRNEAVRDLYQRQFQFILVDEYQDTNHIQSEFIDVLAARHGNVMVVGDDAQSIYSWRGADCLNILEFPQRYPKAQVYRIETNYRSVPEVLSLANAAIAANVDQFPKNLVAARQGNNFKPALVPLADSAQQAKFVTQRVMELHEEGVELSRMAILYRAHFHSMEVQMEMTRRGIPFHITSGMRFFEQAHIKDMAAFLKFAVNPLDEVAFTRMVKLLPGIGQRSADSLWAEVRTLASGPDSDLKGMNALKVPAKAKAAWEQLVHTLVELRPGGEPAPPSEMLKTVFDAMYDDYAKVEFANYEQRREDLTTLINFSRQFTSTADFLDQLALIANVDAEGAAADAEADAVTLSSVHQAKGLEWKIVFVIWLTDGKFPSYRSVESDGAIEEERRLFYVAVTRAMDELYLTYPRLHLGSSGYGDPVQRPSRFLSEIPETLVEEWHVGGGRAY
jgi:DNA helicase-2/ATP-dependent DNA helicase PcrA